MNLEQAQAAFDDIKRGSPIPWTKLQAADAQVALHVVTQPEDLGHLITPWWVGANGERLDWDEPGSRAVVATDNPLPVGRREEVATIANMFRSFQPPVQVSALSYALPEGRQFLLDGTHRVAALAQAGMPFRLLLFSIEGPLDSDYLPELAHFLR